MQQNRILRFATEKLFGGHLEFRVRLFNVLAAGGTLASFIIGWVNLFAGRGLVMFAVDMLGAAGAFALIVFAARTGYYRVCYFITIAAIFLGLFPYVFLNMGGYHGGFTVFFIFAVVFTVVMLDGKAALFVTALELAVYVGLYLFAYLYPEAVPGLPDEKSYLISNILDLLVVGVALGITMHAQMRLYRGKQAELEKANAALKRVNRMKTEFLEDIKHEIRTPLTAISLGAEVTLNNVGNAEGEQKARRALHTVQNEAMRLGRMINGMVELANMSARPQNRERIDFAAMLRTQAEAVRFELEAKGNTLRVEIVPDLPYIYAEAEQIERVPANLLDNAARFTEGGEVTVEASAERNFITVQIRDTGAGVAPELLPHVFERGVSGRGGNGYGLSYCKTIVEAHGGTIEINSQCATHNSQCKSGTTVTFTVPVYGGQDYRAIHNS